MQLSNAHAPLIIEALEKLKHSKTDDLTRLLKVVDSGLSFEDRVALISQTSDDFYKIDTIIKEVKSAASPQ